ncbi:MAG: hypothetical protein WBZ39_03670, partial [Methylovirgula sp.]
MEDCIHADPSAFLGKDVSVRSRQPRIGGFVPDLVLADAKDNLIILEIQQNALDRYHLYKSLEYRDLFAEQENCHPPQIILLCESMHDRFRRLLETHNIQLLQITRSQFIKTAIEKTPNVVSNYLSNDCSFSPSEAISKAVGKIEFKPLDWGYRIKPSDVLAHLYAELGRLGIDIDAVPRSYYKGIYWDVSNLLDSDIEH